MRIPAHLKKSWRSLTANFLPIWHIPSPCTSTNAPSAMKPPPLSGVLLIRSPSGGSIQLTLSAHRKLRLRPFSPRSKAGSAASSCSSLAHCLGRWPVSYWRFLLGRNATHAHRAKAFSRNTRWLRPALHGQRDLRPTSAEPSLRRRPTATVALKQMEGRFLLTAVP